MCHYKLSFVIGESLSFDLDDFGFDKRLGLSDKEILKRTAGTGCFVAMGRRRGESATDQASVVKIMISTDNHLGYLEKDPVRGDDSFRAFEEVLQLAKANSVDMVLLGGDLFHDNKPSRRTIVRTMQILRKMCLGYDDVRLAVRSDPAAVNYMNENYAVSLPVFIIHGNHDDPTGAAGLDALSALDLLSEANLITYFGRVDSAKKIEVSPILLQKGATKIALYGLGNIRDEVLYDTWSRQRKVRWLSPAEDDDDQNAPGTGTAAPEENGDDDGSSASDPGFVRKTVAARQAAKRWFNLFVLHQNRLTRGTARGIAETLLPPWLDYVVWGHEHDSIPELKMSKPAIVQPGSTVATSLSFGESLPKHAILLEVYKGALKHKPIPLRTVRNFEFADVALSDQEGLNPLKPEGVKKFLDEKISEMIERQEALFDVNRAAIEDATAAVDGGGFLYPSHEFYLSKLTRITRQPLIRLRVEISGGWESLNAQRFGQAYVGRSACAADMLLFYRQRRATTSRMFLSGHVDGPERIDDRDPEEYAEALRSEMDDVMRADDAAEKALQIPRLVQYYLYHRKAGGTGLKFLELDKLTSAVDEFVQKSEARAIPEYVQTFLKHQQDRTLDEVERRGKVLNEQEIVARFQNQAMEAANRVLLAENPNQGNTGNEGRLEAEVPMELDNDAGVAPLSKPPERNVEENMEEIHALLSQNPKLAALSAAAAANSEADIDDDDVMPVKGKKPRGRPARAPPGGTQVSRRGGVSRGTTSRRTSTATPRKPPRQSQISFGRQSAVVDGDDDDDIQDESDRQAEEDAASSARRPRAPARPLRRAATSARRTVEISEGEPSEDEAPAPKRKRKATTAAAGSASRSRARSKAAPVPGSSMRVGRSSFGNRAKNRRPTPTIDLDEESGDDAM